MTKFIMYSMWWEYQCLLGKLVPVAHISSSHVAYLMLRQNAPGARHDGGNNH